MLLSTTVHRDRPREGQSSSRDIKWRDFEKQIPKVLLRRHFCTRHTTHTKAEKMFSVVSAVRRTAATSCSTSSSFSSSLCFSSSDDDCSDDDDEDEEIFSNLDACKRVVVFLLSCFWCPPKDEDVEQEVAAVLRTAETTENIFSALV